MALIAVIDDNRLNLTLVADVLRQHDHDPHLFQDPKEFIDAIGRLKPDLVLLDIVMPNITGFEVCSILQYERAYDEVPIIFLSALNNKEDVIKGLELGGVDYIEKPFHPVELMARVNNHLKLKKARDDLRKANEQLKELALRDPLTGLYNRRYAYELLQQFQHEFERSKCPYGIIMIDIDHFKNINDQYGHDLGDKVLMLTSKIIEDALRGQDLVARWGGEEFLLLLKDTNDFGIKMVAEKIKKALEVTAFPEGIQVTVSQGLALNTDASNPSDAIRVADMGLYQAKAQGRNKYIRYADK